MRRHASDVSPCLRTRASRSFRCRRCRNDVHRRHFQVGFRRDSTGSRGQLRPGDLGHRKESVPGSRGGGAGETREMHRVPRKFILSGLDGLESFEPGQSFQLEPGSFRVRLGLIGPVYPVKPTPSTWTAQGTVLAVLKRIDIAIHPVLARSIIPIHLNRANSSTRAAVCALDPARNLQIT